MPAILAAILGFCGRFFTDRLVQYLAFKALILGIMLVILPLVINNFLFWFMNLLYGKMLAAMSTGGAMPSSIIQFTGVSGYIATQLQLPLCLSIILSAVSIRAIMNIIPFFK